MDEPWTILSETDEAIGSRVRDRREAIGLSPEELAAACALPTEQILRYEAGASSLTATQLCAVADLLEVPLTFFHRPGFTHPGLSAGMDSADLLDLFDRLSLHARQQIVVLAMQLAAATGPQEPGT